MKKYTSLLIFGLLVLSLTSCSSENVSNSIDQNTVNLEPSESETITETVVPTETQEIIEEVSETEVTSTSVESETEPSIKVVTEVVNNGYDFNPVDFPVIDGSTATKPLAVGIRSVLLGESREEADEHLFFHRTDDAFYYLMDGVADLLVVAQPCEEVFDLMEENGFGYEMEPIAEEGLVFIVNKTNPVDSLTIDEVQRIYTGEITNWAEVGGDDIPIVPFQRTETSGSQVMMRTCVMEGLTMPEPSTEFVTAEMDQLIEVVSSYNNSANAIGYTVYFYANNMHMADELKILKIEGVEANVDTIRSHEYPFTNPYFCVIPSDTEEDSPARILYDWLKSEEGQKLVETEGYVPIT